jgi:hypothetical protein
MHPATISVGAPAVLVASRAGYGRKTKRRLDFATDALREASSAATTCLGVRANHKAQDGCGKRSTKDESANPHVIPPRN